MMIRSVLTFLAVFITPVNGSQFIHRKQDIKSHDPNCLIAFQSDDPDQACSEAQDSDGNPCVYCHIPGYFGLCLSSSQASEVEHSISCGSNDFAEDVVSGPPLPPDLLNCLKSVDENSCDDSTDPTCFWCETAAGFGLCFDEEAAEVAKQYGPMFRCDSHEFDNVEDPADPSCAVTTSEGEQSCKATNDANGNPCEWCQLMGLRGVCLTSEQAEEAGSIVSCDEEITEETIQSTLDPMCFMAAWNAEDAESACYDALDADGNACVWCKPEGEGSDITGICLNEDQVDLGQYLECDSKGSDDAAIE